MNIEKLTTEEWNYSNPGLFYNFKIGSFIYTYSFKDNYMFDSNVPIRIIINKWKVIGDESDYTYLNYLKFIFENTETKEKVVEEYPPHFLNKFRENKLITINNEFAFFNNKSMYTDIILNLYRINRHIKNCFIENMKLSKKDIDNNDLIGNKDAIKKCNKCNEELIKIGEIINQVYSIQNKVNGKISF